MYIRRKVFSRLIVDGEERYFSTTDYELEEDRYFSDDDDTGLTNKQKAALAAAGIVATSGGLYVAGRHGALGKGAKGKILSFEEAVANKSREGWDKIKGLRKKKK